MAAIVLGLAFAAAAVESQPIPNHPRIVAIEVVAHDVFREPVSGWLYRTANRLHAETREHVIAREILFEVGQSLDSAVEEAIAQTERNLRALAFIRDARIEKIPVGDGEVKLRVVTDDSWSTQPQIGLAKTGNRLTWIVGLAERNFLGLGKQFRIQRESGLDRDQTLGTYIDPRMFGSRFASSWLVSDRSDGRRFFAAFERPFYSLRSRWGLRLAADTFDQLDPIYEAGEQVDSLRHLRRFSELQLSRAVWLGDSSALRLHGGYRFVEDEGDFATRRFGIVRFGLSQVQHRFIKRTHVNRFEASEDFNLGNEARLFFGMSSDALGGEPGRAWFLSASERRGFDLGEESFAIASVSFTGRHRANRWENAVFAGRLEWLQRLRRKTLLIGKAEYVHGIRLDPGVQIRLGAERGLRGYPVRQFNGDRSALTGLETRWFFADDVKNLLSFALAGFIESGYVWPEGDPIRGRDLKSDVGVALLIGRTRWAGQSAGVRLDFAFALNPIEGVRRWQVSAGSDVRF